ncbi:tuberous sclerosis 1 protein hamartin [Arctopsyche grandis]|uniref:tuberous sclerosis 1 protein hamartin n=1 Tax=Arctopsyche grandis TaxID=121162 RepID=UPI00406D645E
MSSAEVSLMLRALESTRHQEAADVRSKLSELLAGCKDSWLVVGLVEYQLTTGSARVADVLVKVPPPHDKVLLDRTADLLRMASAPARTQTLALLAHVVRRQPLWLHKLPKHPLFRDLLHLLRDECEPVPLLSGLLLLITLLPMIPTFISPYFQDIFEVFGRLAAWEGRTAADPHRDHLQLALYGLFQNLYAMFPCNFVDYLRREYVKKENLEVFAHTVRPMLESVRMHPLLITASKNSETDNARWKKMEHHDVVVECRRFSSEGARCARPSDDDGRFRSRCGTDVSSLAAPHLHPSKASNSTPNLTESQTTMSKTTEPLSVAAVSRRCESIQPGADSWFSLSDTCGALSAPQTPLPLTGMTSHDTSASQTPVSQMVSVGKQQDSGSPPEAAIEATPENTPIKDTRQRFNFPNSPVVRALNTRHTQNQTNQQYLVQQSSSSYSQPPSPLKKELSPFNRMYSVESTEERKDAVYTLNRLNRVMYDRSQQQTIENFPTLVPSPQKQQFGSPLKKWAPSTAAVSSVPNSPVPLGTAAPISGTTDWLLAKPKPQKDGMPFDPAANNASTFNFNPAENINKEDREIMELSKRGEMMRSTSINRDVHSVLNDPDPKVTGSGSRQHHEESHEEGDEHWVEDDTVCEGEARHCIEKKHGLHMPHSNSMLEIARRVADRSRFHSQCIHEPSASYVAESPLETDTSGVLCCYMRKKKINLRKSMSCPEIHTVEEKSTPDTIEKDKEAVNARTIVSFENGNIESIGYKKCSKNEETQTIEIWPIGYEYLFADILQNVCDQTVKPANAIHPEELDYLSYRQIDKYIEVSAQNKSKDVHDKRAVDEITTLKQRLELLQLELSYEKYGREVHASRNRRLLGRSRKNRATEEQNLALRQQMSLLQTEIDDLRLQVTKQKQNMQLLEKQNQENVKYWQHQIRLRDIELSAEREEKERLYARLLEEHSSNNETCVDVQNLRATLFDVSQQLQRAIRKSELGERQIECIKQLQRELIICGEKDARYREVLNMIPSKTDMLINKLTQQFKEQVTNMQAMLQMQTSKMEYFQTRETELEALISCKDFATQELKKQLRLVKEEYSEKLKSVEDKYQSVKRINQRMEAHCLELLQRVPQSPQTLSRDLTSGFSPQSSPLSASLASSEGHAPLLASRVDEIRNLQVIVNVQETIEETASNSVNNAIFEDDTH